MPDVIYQHFKQLLSRRIICCREGRMCMLRRELRLVMQFRTAVHRNLSINNTLNLSNLVSFTWP